MSHVTTRPDKLEIRIIEIHPLGMISRIRGFNVHDLRTPIFGIKIYLPIRVMDTIYRKKNLTEGIHILSKHNATNLLICTTDLGTNYAMP